MSTTSAWRLSRGVEVPTTTVSPMRDENEVSMCLAALPSGPREYRAKRSICSGRSYEGPTRKANSSA